MATTCLVVGVIASLQCTQLQLHCVGSSVLERTHAAEEYTVRYDCTIVYLRVGGTLALASDPFEEEILSEGLCANFGGDSAVPFSFSFSSLSFFLFFATRSNPDI